MESKREEDRQMLAKAARLRAPLVQAARLAASNGLGYVVFGAATVLLSLSTDLSDLIALGVGATLLFVGVSARRLAPRLRDGDADAARELARNELVLLAAIAIYCVLMLTVVPSTGDEIDDLLNSGGYAIDVASISRDFYALVLVIAALYQGGLSLHFRRKAPLAEAYVANVPEWARQAIATLPH